MIIEYLRVNCARAVVIFQGVRISSIYFRPALKLTSNGRRQFSSYSEITSEIFIVSVLVNDVALALHFFILVATGQLHSYLANGKSVVRQR